MILIFLLLGIGLFMIGFLLLPTKRQRLIGGSLGLLLLVSMATLMIGNDNWHWGMHHTTTTKSVKIASVSPSKQLQLLVYQPIRHATKERVYVYRLANQTRQRHTDAGIKTSNQVRYCMVKEATLTTTTTRWTYNNRAWQWLFSWTGQHSTLVSHKNTFTLPKSWSTLSARQTKWLNRAVTRKEAKAKQDVAKTIANTLLAAKKADPMITPTEMTAVKAKSEQAAKYQARQQMTAILAQLLKQAQQQPSN